MLKSENKLTYIVVYIAKKIKKVMIYNLKTSTRHTVLVRMIN